MKYSQFNNHFFYEQKYIWFNSFSNEFLILEPILHELLIASITENNPLELKDIHQDFLMRYYQKILFLINLLMK